MREISIPMLASSYRTGLLVRRCFAAFVDFVVVFLLAGAAAPLYVERGPAAIALGIALIWIGYHAFLEACLGVTVGKWLAGIRVATAQGNPPGLRRAVVRSALRLVEVNPILLAGLPAGIVAERSEFKQRLGDKLAGTFVVKYRDLHRALPWLRISRLPGPHANFLERPLFDSRGVF
jgi:uncharacterized RDD family membrane protein YckC